MTPGGSDCPGGTTAEPHCWPWHRSRHEQNTQAGKTISLTAPAGAAPALQADFDEVLRLIDAARTRALASVNQELVGLYWQVGEYISRKIAADGWGQGTVEALAEYIRRKQPNARGFSASNLWRMMQFYQTYRDQPKLATLSRELSWSHNLAILSRSKRDEEREFYLRMAIRERWSFRELQRQLDSALFERVVLSPAKVSPPLTQLHPDAASVFRVRHWQVLV
jgi:predicted nuclease of restriction endonuclease-like (RecB) superfamily